jgi:hypothetical protein
MSTSVNFSLAEVVIVDRCGDREPVTDASSRRPGGVNRACGTKSVFYFLFKNLCITVISSGNWMRSPKVRDSIGWLSHALLPAR